MATFYSNAKFRRAFIAFVGGRTIQAGAGLLLTLLTVRVLEKEQYGLYMLLWGAVEIAEPMTSLGMLPAVQQFLPRLAVGGSSGQRRQFLVAIESARYGLIAVAAALVGWQWEHLARWLHWEVGGTELRVLFPLLMVAVLVSRFTAEMLESLLAQSGAQIARAIQPIGRLVALTVLWFAGMAEIMNLLWADILVCSISAVVGNIWLRRVLGAVPSGAGIDFSMGRVWRFVGNMSLAQLAEAMGNAGMVRIVAGRWLGLEMAGVFAFMQQVVMIANRYMPALLLASVVRPMIITRHVQGEHSMAAACFGLLLKINLGVSVGLLGAAAIGGADLAKLLGAQAAPHLGLAMCMLLIGLLASSQQQVAGMAMQVYGYTKQLLLVRLLAPGASLGAAVGAMWGSLIGLTVGVAAGQVVCSLVMLAVLQRQPLRIMVDNCGRLRILMLAAAAGVACLFAKGWVGSIVAAGVFTTLYTALVLISRPLSDVEGALVGRAAGAKKAALLRPFVRGADVDWCG